MMGRCNSGWHHIDSPAALRVSCHFTAGDLLGCTVAAFTERHPAFRLSISAGGGRGFTAAGPPDPHRGGRGGGGGGGGGVEQVKKKKKKKENGVKVEISLLREKIVVACVLVFIT